MSALAFAGVELELLRGHHDRLDWERPEHRVSLSWPASPTYVGAGRCNA